MRIIVEKIFPTTIFCCDNVLEPEYVDSMRDDIIKSSKTKDSDNWQSNPKLHEHPKYKALSNAALEVGNQYLKSLNFEYENIVITDMWSNILKPGEMHRPHTHSNNVLSGVFYVEAENTSAIEFSDPRPANFVLMPKVKKFDKENSNVWFYPSVTNRLLMFPSWLQHYVPINKTNKNRISIAFNLMYKGFVGVSTDYQSAEF